MADFEFKWREPGMDGMNAEQANGNMAANRNGFDAFTRAAETNGANTYQDARELDAEISQIRRRIAALEIEREQLEKNRLPRDELDRKLAANRARVSDFGTARAHWGDIDARKQNAETWQRQKEMREADEARAARGAIEQLKNDIDKQNTLLSWGTENKAFAADLQLYNRLVDKLRKEYGVEYDPRATLSSGASGSSVPGGSVVPMTDEGWKIFETQFKDKNGNWISEDWKQFYLQNRPQNTAEAAEAVKRVAAENTTDEAAEKEAETKRMEAEAIDEIMTNYGPRSIGKDIQATNGKTVKVERIPNGVRYRCGKSYKDVAR